MLERLDILAPGQRLGPQVGLHSLDYGLARIQPRHAGLLEPALDLRQQADVPILANALLPPNERFQLCQLLQGPTGGRRCAGQAGKLLLKEAELGGLGLKQLLRVLWLHKRVARSQTCRGSKQRE